MYLYGQLLTQDDHFQDHIEADIPVQVYYQSLHKDIGYIDMFNRHFVKINQTFYSRKTHSFVSRPGY